MTLAEEHASDRAAAGFSHPLSHGPVGSAIDIVVKPAGVVGLVSREFGLDHLRDEGSRGLRTGGERRQEEQQTRNKNSPGPHRHS